MNDLARKLLRACEAGDLDAVERLLAENGESALHEGGSGRTALHIAAERGDVALADRLLRHGADPNAKDEDAGTPLHRAANCGGPKIVERLLKAGAEVNARDRDEATPLHYAANLGCTESIERLLKAGADMNARDGVGGTPLHWAVWRGHRKAAECLARHGAEVNTPDSKGLTPLHEAARWGYRAIAEILLAHGADPTIVNNEGCDAAVMAEMEGHWRLAPRLRSAATRLLARTPAPLGTAGPQSRKGLPCETGAADARRGDREQRPRNHRSGRPGPKPRAAAKRQAGHPSPHTMDEGQVP